MRPSGRPPVDGRRKHKLIAFVVLTRPHFLLGGIVMGMIGAFAVGLNDWSHFLAAEVLIVFALVTAHYVNEYADYEADLAVVNRTSFSGGSGVLVNGTLERTVALYAGLISSTLTLACAAYVATFSVGSAVFALAGLAISWGYSMPPVRLLDTGWGELATAVTVTGFFPAVGALSQQSSVPSDLVVIMVMLGILQIAMLLAFELPDLNSDAAAGKRVLGVRLGKQHTIRLMTTCVSAVAVILLTVAITDALPPPLVVGALIGAPPAVLMLWAARRDRHKFTTLGGVAAFFLMSCGLALGLLSASA